VSQSPTPCANADCVPLSAHMKEISNSNFGLLIAYVLPGFIVIWGLSGFWPVMPFCVDGSEQCAVTPSLIGFLNSTVAAVAAGMAVSAIRFVLIDTIHHLTGLQRPAWNGAALQDNVSAVNILVEQHYRYYQFYANMLVAGVIAVVAHLHQTSFDVGLIEWSLVVLAVIFWIGSRDSLNKYYSNLRYVLTTNTDLEFSMTNGMHHEKKEPKTKAATNTNQQPKAQPKPQAAAAKPSAK